MKRKIFAWLTLAGVVFFSSCSNSGQKEVSSSNPENEIVQKDDGTISLVIDNADVYHDENNPSTNTAEWNVKVSKTGRYDVWLSSVTKDTTKLEYKNPVMLSVLDNRIEAVPEVDKVVEEAGTDKFPFRADSFVGSMFIQDTGSFNIQVISDKIIPEDISGKESSKLVSVVFKPAVN